MALPDDTHIVFFGNSHVECAINDTILKNCFNFGRSGERMEFIYSKVKLVQKYNSDLDTIVIGYDNVLLSHSSTIGFNSVLYNPYFFDTFSSDNLAKMMACGSFDYIESHIVHPFNWLKFTDNISSYLGKKTDITNMNNLGGYLYLYRDKLEEDIIRRGDNKYITTEFDELSVYFLNQTIEFCKDKNISVIFLFPPQHGKCPLDSTYYSRFYKNNYQDIKFYDFKDLQLPDSCFGDLDHLNHKGAAVFSEYLEREVFHKQNYPANLAQPI